MSYIPVQIVLTRLSDGRFKVTTFDGKEVVNQAEFHRVDSVLAVLAEEIPLLETPRG